MKETIKLFYGGVMNLGREMNTLSKKLKPFVGIKEMAEADIRLADLECVIADKGKQRLMKDHSYFRADLNQINILVDAEIDIVLTANDHSCDYGTEALLNQREYLDAARILHAGSGKNISEAFAPVFKKVRDITIAIFSVDTTMASSAATADKPGTAYLPTDNLELWKEIFTNKIREAHEKADVVIVAPHWGGNFVQKPSEQTKNLAHLLIDLGADAVLGCNSHMLQDVENYKERPIIYDAGDFLFDNGERDAGCFVLEISSSGVEKVTRIPLKIIPGQTTKATAKQATEISFAPPPRESKVIKDFVETEEDLFINKVPDESIIPPKNFDGLKLVGCFIPAECRKMTERRLLYVETYWTIDEQTDKDFSLSIKGVPVRECDMPPYSQGSKRKFLKFSCPVNRWKPGIIYREKFGLFPPEIDKTANVDLQLEMKVALDGKTIGEFREPDLIKMRIANLPYYNTDFDNIIYHSELGKCWTAEQLAKVTGGEWIVPPPKGWYIRSFSEINSNTGRTLRARPTLFTAIMPSRDHHKKILDNVNYLDGAIVSEKVEGLPPDFPLLKVEDPVRASIEIGFASRKRFQGKVIAVTGSSGKTTTCNMLRHLLGVNHNVTSTPGNNNLYEMVAWFFANVKQEDAYAIVEMASFALDRPYGSVTYEITPNVAVVTSITCAHTIQHGSLEGVAKYKSRIFCGMSPGSYAVINRDMPYYEIFEQKANSLNLNVITFGTHPEATIRMPVLKDGGEFYVMGKSYKLSCPVPVDQLYDALAVIGVLISLGIPFEKNLDDFKSFKPVVGRGNVLKVNLNGKNLTVINSTFNANPLSMKYALQHLRNFEPNQKSRVAILGDIAELGEQSIEYHKELANSMLASEPDRILLCGKFMRYPYELIRDKLNAVYFETFDKLFKGFENYLQNGDTVLIKSSHATGLFKIVVMLNSISK